jgi:LPXTG-motif cell wall-anchored protein
MVLLVSVGLLALAGLSGSIVIKRRRRVTV